MTDRPGTPAWLERGPNGRPWRVLIVDDSPSIRLLARTALEEAGFNVAEEGSAESAARVVAEAPPDVVLLDVQLPGRSGLELLVDLRTRSGLPVLLVTSRADLADRVAGLELGADDYIVKPFSPAELVARTRATVRGRWGGMIAPVLHRGRVIIDLHQRRIELDGVDLTFTAREFDLLSVLAAEPGRTFTRAELLEAVWGSRSDWQDPNTVTEHVSRIRKKLAAADSSSLDMIETVRGGGYRFRR